MKYTIHGFSQEQAIRFKKIVNDKNGKGKEIRLDATDLLILRWFIDFYPNMMKVEIDGEQYAWFQYHKILEDLPLLDIKKQALADRLQKLCEFDILKHKTVKSQGTFSYYKIGKSYNILVDTKCSQLHNGVYSTTEGVCSQLHNGVYSTTEGVCSQLHNGVYSTTEQINTSIKDTSIKNNKSIKDTNKAASGIDSVLVQWVNNNIPEQSRDNILDLLREWVSIRKQKRAPSTVRAIELNLEKLIPCANSSNMTVAKYLEEVICRGWQAFYETPNMVGGQNNGKYAHSTGGDTDYGRGEETLGTMF